MIFKYVEFLLGLWKVEPIYFYVSICRKKWIDCTLTCKNNLVCFLLLISWRIWWYFYWTNSRTNFSFDYQRSDFYSTINQTYALLTTIWPNSQRIPTKKLIYQINNTRSFQNTCTNKSNAKKIKNVIKNNFIATEYGALAK